MSDDEVEIAKRAWDALQRGDLDSFLELIDPGVEFNTLIAEAEGRTFRGHTGVREWWDLMASSLGGVRYDVNEFRDLGNGVLTHLVAIGTVGGVEVPQAMWQVAQIRDGKCIWWGAYRTDREAIDALATRS